MLQISALLRELPSLFEKNWFQYSVLPRGPSAYQADAPLAEQHWNLADLHGLEP